MNEDNPTKNNMDMHSPENDENQEIFQVKLPKKLNEGDIHVRELRKSADNKKIQPMKKLAETGRVEHLKYILPLSQYSSDFLRGLAKKTTCKIILRELQRSFEEQNISESDKVRYINLLVSLEPNYNYIKKFNLKNLKIQAILINILAQGDKEFTVRKLGELLVDTDKYTRCNSCKDNSRVIEQHSDQFVD